MATEMDREFSFRIRTITCFLCFAPDDFVGDSPGATSKLAHAANFLLESKDHFEGIGYEVQTIRIATNPFGTWLKEESQLDHIKKVLEEKNVGFCSLGPADNLTELSMCFKIISKSSLFSCSANLRANDVSMANGCAKLVQELAKVRNGLGNFQFCVAAAASANIPFFPIAKSAPESNPSFAVGLETGSLACKLLKRSKSIANIPTTFASGMAEELRPIQNMCRLIASTSGLDYVGIDTSLNPSLQDMNEEFPGSVAGAIEALDEVRNFGGSGTLAAAASITTTLQSLPGIQHCGYSGIMLPVCEDKRLAELSASSSPSSALSIANLLSISHVCGVGVDTVPIPGDVSMAALTSLFLDVAGMAHRWNKSLSCRVFPVQGKPAGTVTEFDSPYMVNAHVLPLP